ncbi:indoleamine 2,3-dioxygenase [Phanerochaete sordida]|uniref:Indoleamine 2,3-dioxygenase n=1 Tax=Phanerochaete sordida TaxID=48140 RepID=A0A9P3G3V3_9APHY|nr:indoleamine 2,3-dioxygenase [Phanerochaete sordida]
MEIGASLSLINFLSSVDVRQVARSLRGALTKDRSLCQVDFDVDPNTGFFPPQPLPRLSGPFDIWERALVDAQEALSLGDDESPDGLYRRPTGERWRAAVRSWRVLDASVWQMPQDIRFLQRAHMVLAFLVHFYVHSTPTTDDAKTLLIPRSLAIPFVHVSEALSIPPVLTFADTVLWNWELIRPEEPLSAENIRYVTLLSGNENERAFYALSGAIELKGVEMLQIIESFMTLPSTADVAAINSIARNLSHLKDIIDELTSIFQTCRDSVDPQAFYWHCRPWWNGSPPAGSSKPQWEYEGVSASKTRYTAGPSAGQSSVMHALDIFLDIDHKLAQRRLPAPSEANKKADTSFMDRMRLYMPGFHREYLQYLAASPRSVRDVAQRHPALREPYNAAVAALKRLRDVHIRIVTLYVVTQSHSAPPANIQMRERDGGVARGTGGNEASNLLKHGRDATSRAMLRD